jgi:hypothetical protein
MWQGCHHASYKEKDIRYIVLIGRVLLMTAAMLQIHTEPLT